MEDPQGLPSVNSARDILGSSVDSDQWFSFGLD
jgi:hypothetical protein